MTDSETYADWTRRHYTETAAAVIRRLRDSVDRMEREAAQVRQPTGSQAGPYSYAAQRVVHEFTWGVANADLPGLILAAAEADQAAPDPEP